MAKEWGAGKDRNGYVNCYQIETNGLSLLDLNGKAYPLLHWLTTLLQNRYFDVPSPPAQEAKDYLIEYFSIPYEQYDIITGYRADDSYFSFAQDFINRTISVRQLGNAMKLGKLRAHFVPKSKKAFDAVLFTGYKVAESSE